MFPLRHELRTPREEIVSPHGRKFTPTPKFLVTAKAYCVCHIGPIFQISLIYAFIVKKFMNRRFSAIVLGLLAWSITTSKGSMKFFIHCKEVHESAIFGHCARPSSLSIPRQNNGQKTPIFATQCFLTTSKGSMKFFIHWVSVVRSLRYVGALFSESKHPFVQNEKYSMDKNVLDKIGSNSSDLIG
jgi:hypothetical protein